MVRAFRATETVSTGDGDYTLSINIEIIDAIEDDFDLSFDQVAKLIDKGRLGKVSRFLRCLLLPSHPDITLDETFGLAREYGDLFNHGMRRLLEKANPEPEEKDENPPKAHRGTGGNSSSHGARQGSRRASSGNKRRELSPSS